MILGPQCSGHSSSNTNHQFIPNKNDANSGATYKCVFCNHIFKSHYCYQKHKRRHLNPFTVDFTIAPEQKHLISTSQFSTPNQTTQQATTSSSSSSLQALQSPVTADNAAASSTISHPTKDINVQFFPCKICGAKFPSYYFVHKHKKIWHPEAVNDSPPTSAPSTICNENVKN